MVPPTVESLAFFSDGRGGIPGLNLRIRETTEITEDTEKN